MREQSPRPKVLAYPSPTTSRFIVFLAALLTAGAFVGAWIHNQVLGDAWLKTVSRCEQQSIASATSGTTLPSQIEQNAAQERCRASAERRRAAFSFGGALAAGGAGLLVLFLVPVALERRRSLRLLPPTLTGAAERATEACARRSTAARADADAGPERDARRFQLPHAR